MSIENYMEFSDWLYTLGLKCDIKDCGDEGCVVEAILGGHREQLKKERWNFALRLNKTLNEYSHSIQDGGLDAKGFFRAMEKWEHELLSEK